MSQHLHSSATTLLFCLLVVLMVQSLFAINNQHDKFVGLWRLTESENIDEYLENLGVSYEQGMFRRSELSIRISVDPTGKKWKIDEKHRTSQHAFSWEFELDKPIQTTAPDGRRVQSTFSFDDEGKLVHEEKAKDPGEIDSLVVRSIENGKLITRFSAGGVTAKRTYERDTSDTSDTIEPTVVVVPTPLDANRTGLDYRQPLSSIDD